MALRRPIGAKEERTDGHFGLPMRRWPHDRRAAAACKTIVGNFSRCIATQNSQRRLLLMLARNSLKSNANALDLHSRKRHENLTRMALAQRQKNRYMQGLRCGPSRFGSLTVILALATVFSPIFRRRSYYSAAISLAMLGCGALSTAAVAQGALEPAQPLSAATPNTSPSAAPGQPTRLSLELNKLETFDKGCRAYIVVNNTTELSYQALKLDLVLFQTDAVIGRRFALDLAPVRAQKKSVKLFEIDQMACDKIGSFLINDVIDCKTEAGPADACLQRLATSSLSSVQLSK